MGLLMGDENTQRIAERKRNSSRNPRVTGRRAASMPRGMPEMSDAARAAYSMPRIRAAILSVFEEKKAKGRWSWQQWADKAGISSGSIRGFALPDAGMEDEETSMYLSAIVRLAWAANVSVARLIGEAEPQPPEVPSQPLAEQLRREIELTAEAQDLRQRLLDQM